ncbi:MAG: hypothetical protein ABIA63_01800 [bacterium]
MKKEKYDFICEKDLKCSGWETSMEQIIGAQMLANNHGMKYTGKAFIFCPWCGKRIFKKIHNQRIQPTERLGG